MTIGASPQMAPGSRSVPVPGKCPYCRRWKPDPDDRCCGWCGEPLMIPSVEPRQISFTREKPERVLHVTNDGVNALAVQLVWEGLAGRRFRCTQGHPFLLSPGEQRSVTLSFDFSGSPSGEEYSGTLYVDSSAPGKLERINVTLEAELPPCAKLIPPDHIRPVLVVGDDPLVRVGVKNDGGGTLRVTGVQLLQPAGLQANLAASVEVVAGETAQVGIRINVEDLAENDYTLRGNLGLEGGDTLAFVREFRYERPGRLSAEEDAVRCDLYRIARRVRRELKLSNIGGRPVQINYIRSDKRWAHGQCKNARVEPGKETYADITVEYPDGEIEEPMAVLDIESDGYASPLRIPIRVHLHQLEALEDAIGIDFGTSVSCVARIRNGDPELVDINPEDSSDTVEGHGLPSIVFFDDDFFPLVGQVARQRARLDPGAAVKSVKRILGSSTKIRVRDREMEPRHVSAEIFRALLSAVEIAHVQEKMFRSPVGAVMTVPADMSDAQITDVLESGRQAGLNVDHAAVQDYILDEPSAAALCYLWQSRKARNLREHELVFIYDFGAGTLDCSLVLFEKDRRGTRVEVLATTGDRELGGDDIDLAIARKLAQQLREKHTDFDDSAIQMTERELHSIKGNALYGRTVGQRHAWVEAAERIKRELSAEAECKTLLPASPGQKAVELRLSRDVFEKQILSNFLKRSLEVVEGCCAVASVRPDRVDSVLHTGRVSLIPAIRQSVNRYFPNAKDRSELVTMKTCVALGAAWWAYIKNLPGMDIEFKGLKPSLPHSIGYLAAEGFQAVFKEIFPAGQGCPSSEVIVQLQARPRMAFRLEIVEKEFGIGRERRRGRIELAATTTQTEHEFHFKLTANRILEVLLANQARVEILPSRGGESLR